MNATSDILLEGLTFPECPRWHEGGLWFSDMHANRIMRMTADGHAATMVDNARQPAGLGWLANGDLLYNRMVDRTLVRRTAAGSEAIAADLTAHEAVQINDMVVSAEGRAYIAASASTSTRARRSPPQTSYWWTSAQEDGRPRPSSPPTTCSFPTA